MARAARRTHPRPSERPPSEVFKRAVCAALFAETGCVESVLAHRVADRFTIDPHAHDDLLQFDLIDGCAGEVTLGPRRQAVAGVTLMVAHPGVRHGYVLRPTHRDARVCLFRLRYRPSGGPALAELQAGLPPLDHLARLITDAAGLWTPQGTPLAATAKLADAVCAWPDGDDATGVAAAAGERGPAGNETPYGDAVADRIRRAVADLSRRVDDPPDLDELARAASVSPRHFARRFTADFNCTPHAYVTARRVDAARAKLLAPDAPVARVAEELGFTSAAAFARWFTRQVGQTPRAFQREPGVF